MRAMLIRAADVDHEGQLVTRRTAWFDDLTLAHLAAVTPADVELTTVIERLEPVDFDADVDLVGITAMGVSPMLRGYQIADRFRARGVPVVLGGTNFGLQAEESLAHADAVVVGDGERAWPQIIDDCRHRAIKPKYVADPAGSLDGLPVPRYDLFRGRPEFRGAFRTVQASRGCPHSCDFCAVSATVHGTVRFRPIDEVIRDVKATGGSRIFFADDNLMARPSYYKELFRRLIPLRIHWFGAATLSIARDPEMLALARQSGCVLLVIGIESIGQENLDGVRKGFNQVGEYSTLLKRIHGAGIVASCSTIFGFDEDDPGVFDRTVDFMIENRVRVAPFFILTPIPGTVTWRRMKSEGRILTDDFSRYDTVTAVFRPAKMLPEELEAGLRHAYRKLHGLGSIARRLFPPLGNMWADLIALAMNRQFRRVAQKDTIGVFNFN